MAMIVNKMLRVIPKKDKIEAIDCYSICKTLAETGGELWEKVIYFVNKEENCLDIKYKSRKGRGDLGLGIEDNFADFDIWVIQNYEGGSDFISCYNYLEYELDNAEITNLYCFDEIRLKGNHHQLIKDFYPNFFQFQENKPPFLLKQAILNQENQFISINIEGVYNAGTIYNVGEEYSDIPELVTKEEFFKPRSVSYWEARFLCLPNRNNYGLKKQLDTCIKDKFESIDWDETNLFEIQICNKGRVVKKVEIGKHWKYYNAEFFDNTIEKNWIDYLALWRRGLI